MIAGVAGGLAEYFDTDPTLIRILFVLLTLLGFGGLGIITYIVLWIVMPEPTEMS
jgi:phage shock protein C